MNGRSKRCSLRVVVRQIVTVNTTDTANPVNAANTANPVNAANTANTVNAANTADTANAVNPANDIGRFKQIK